MATMILKVLVGCVLGALMGYYGQCSSGTCPLTLTWWRGAIYGGVLGLLFAVLSGDQGATEMNKSTQNVKHLAEADFDAAITNSTLPVLVDFYAPWCGPCKALAPELERQAEAFNGRIEFLKVNVDEAAELSRKFNIQGVPSLLFFKDGKVVDTIVGRPAPETLKTRLEALAGK